MSYTQYKSNLTTQLFQILPTPPVGFPISANGTIICSAAQVVTLLVILVLYFSPSTLSYSIK